MIMIMIMIIMIMIIIITMVIIMTLFNKQEVRTSPLLRIPLIYPICSMGGDEERKRKWKWEGLR